MEPEDGTSRDPSPEERDGSPDGQRALSDALDAVGVGVVLYDSEGTVARVNDTAAAVFDLPESRLLEMDRRSLLVDHLAPTAADTTAFTTHALDTERSGARFLANVASGDDRRWLDARSQPIDDSDAEGGRVELYSDVTEYVRSAYPIRELSHIVARDAPFTDRLSELLDLGREVLELPNGFVTAIDDRTQTVVESVGDHERLQPGATCPILETYCRNAIANEGVVAIADATRAGWTEDPAYERFGLESYVGAPVAVDGDTYGTLGFGGRESRDAFSDDEELYVDVAATWIGYEIERLGR